MKCDETHPDLENTGVLVLVLPVLLVLLVAVGLHCWFHGGMSGAKACDFRELEGK